MYLLIHTAMNTTMAPMRLEWMETPHQREVYRLGAGPIIIGRRSDADIILTHSLVSRQHVRILIENQDFIIVDLQSSHGTWVNGTRIDRHVLQSQDRIRLGEDGAELIFLSGDDNQTILSPVGLSSGNMLEEAGIESSVHRLASMLPLDTEHSELEKISCLLDFHYNFGKTFSAEKTFQHILKSALGISGAERGFILRREHGEFAFALGLDSAGNTLGLLEFHRSGSVVDRVAQDGQPVFMTQGIHGDLAGSESIVAMNLRAVACLPLEGMSPENDAPAVMGILYLDSRRHMHALSGLDEKLLTRLAGEAGHVIEKLELVVALAERRLLEQELAVAEETQRSLLPQTLPQPEPFRIRAFSRPTRQLGGDFYDFISVKNVHLTGLLADVSGKGIPAALLSSFTLGALNMEFLASAQPDLVLNRVNKLLCERTPVNRFVTLFLFQLDAGGKGHFIGAGHNPAFLFRAASGEVERLESDGIPLGMFSFTGYAVVPLELQPGDMLVVYSDGLTEAENGVQEEFSEERLLNLIRAQARQGADVMEEALLTALDQFTRGASQNDDITFLLVEHCANAVT